MAAVQVDQGGAGAGDGGRDVGDTPAHDAGADDGDRSWSGHAEPPGSTVAHEPKRPGPTGQHPLPGTAGCERYARRLMSETTERPAPRRPRVPQWLYEGVDLVQQRRRALLITFGLVVVVAAVVTFVAPDVLPPTPLVGAAVGLAGLLLAMAVLIALDTASIKVRGPRHIRAAGGELVAVLPSEPVPAGADDLARAIQDARPGGRTLLLGMAAATGDGKRVGRWASVVARSLAEQGTSVLSLDLTAEGGDRSGFLDVVRHGYKLGEVVDLDPEVRLATLGPGRDATEALRAFNEAGRWIPRDLEVLLVALPKAASRAVVRASLALDQLLIVAERDRTSRVELIAGLDATEAVGTHAQVILLDDTYASYLGIGAVETRSEPEPPQDDEVASDPELDELLGHASGGAGHEDVPGDAPDSTEVAETDSHEERQPDGAAAPEPPPEPEPKLDPAASEPVVDPRSEPAADGETAALGVRDVQVMMGAAAEAALADISANAEAADDLDTRDEARGAGGGVETDAVVGVDANDGVATADRLAAEGHDAADDHGRADETERHEADEPAPVEGELGARSDELTVRVRRPEPLDEDEATLEVERPAEVGDAVASSTPEPTEDDQAEPSRPIELNEAEDDEDLLNATARLSLLMDEVTDRDADAHGDDGRA